MWDSGREPRFLHTHTKRHYKWLPDPSAQIRLQVIHTGGDGEAGAASLLLLRVAVMHPQARNSLVSIGNDLVAQEGSTPKNSLSDSKDQLVQWELVARAMRKFDEATAAAFDDFRTLPGDEGTDREQVFNHPVCDCA